MKIIKPGTLEEKPDPLFWVGVNWVCGKCDCVFQLQYEDDVQVRSFPRWTNEFTDERVKTSCPYCFTSCYLNRPKKTTLKECCGQLHEFLRLMKCGQTTKSISGGFGTLSETRAGSVPHTISRLGFFFSAERQYKPASVRGVGFFVFQQGFLLSTLAVKMGYYSPGGWQWCHSGARV